MALLETEEEEAEDLYKNNLSIYNNIGLIV